MLEIYIQDINNINQLQYVYILNWLYLADAIQNGILLEHLGQSNVNSDTNSYLLLCIFTPQNGHGVFLSGISSFTGFLAIFSIFVLNLSLIYDLYSGFINVIAH